MMELSIKIFHEMTYHKRFKKKLDSIKFNQKKQGLTVKIQREKGRGAQ
jgi:hypothetical protein